MIMMDWVIWVISYISLFLSVFWISLMYLEDEEIRKIRKNLKEYPLVSIIVPAYNEEKTIAQTIRSVLNLDYPKDKLEVIAVNDGSTDKTWEIIKKIKDPRLIALTKKNGGKGKACPMNFGIKHSKGEFIGCVDADALVEPDCLKLMIPHFVDQDIGAVISAFKVQNPKNFLQKLQWFEYICSVMIRRLLASLKALYVTPGAISLYRKKAVLEAGGFDEDNITEDLEIAMHLQYLGYDIKSEINAVSYPVVPDTIPKLHTQRVRWYRGWIQTVIKYKDMIFNPKYGFLGTFYIPVSILVPILLITVTLFIGYNFTKLAYGAISTLIVVKGNILPILTAISAERMALSMNALMFPTMMISLSGIYLVNKAHKYLKEKWKFPLAILIYFSLYQLVLSGYWLVAVIYEVADIKEKWR